jgi:hypothetical protein
MGVRVTAQPQADEPEDNADEPGLVVEVSDPTFLSAFQVQYLCDNGHEIVEWKAVYSGLTAELVSGGDCFVCDRTGRVKSPPDFSRAAKAIRSRLDHYREWREAG